MKLPKRKKAQFRFPLLRRRGREDQGEEDGVFVSHGKFPFQPLTLILPPLQGERISSFLKSVAFLIVFLFGLIALSRIGSAAESDGFIQRRHVAANRQRRIIFNNDGNEPVYFCNAATAGELLKSRTTPLAGTQVDSIFYCTWSSGFGMFTHHTKVGQLFNTREEMFAPNRTQEFFEKGIDPLRVMIDFARKNKMEIFWSMRMNDTHDASASAYGPVMFRANKLKQEHPEYLIGSNEKRSKFGHWTAVNYGMAEVRDLAFKYCEEVCQNYDVDGIELDFFRHPFFFKSSGNDEACTSQEREQMTALMRRIRAMTEEIGRKRNRPILIAMRIPDSVEYCKFIGLDLERWLADGLLDLMIAGGYVNLNPWETSVALGHKYGVKVYPSLDDPRVRDKNSNELRSSIEAYRGRAANAWAAGVDGIYLFNFFNPYAAVWRELGDAQSLKRADKDYFVSVLGRGGVDVPHDKFQNLPTLNPASPLKLSEKPIEVIIRAPEDFPRKVPHRRITLRLELKNPPQPKTLQVSLNKTILKNGKAETNWLQFAVEAKLLQQTNQIEIVTTGEPALLTDAMLSVRYSKPNED